VYTVSVLGILLLIYDFSIALMLLLWPAVLLGCWRIFYEVCTLIDAFVCFGRIFIFVLKVIPLSTSLLSHIVTNLKFTEDLFVLHHSHDRL
jgi:hypothetical protein